MILTWVWRFPDRKRCYGICVLGSLVRCMWRVTPCSETGVVGPVRRLMQSLEKKGRRASCRDRQTAICRVAYNQQKFISHSSEGESFRMPARSVSSEGPFPGCRCQLLVFPSHDLVLSSQLSYDSYKNIGHIKRALA